MPIFPRISVVIPTLNEEQKIADLLEKLQYLSELEVIVVDGGSKDNTRQICSRYPVRLISAQRGRGTQLNAGADVSRGEALIFLHADTDFESRIFADIEAALDAGATWGCCTMAFDYDDTFYRMLAFFSNLRSRFFSSCYGDQVIYCRKETFQRAGRFPPIPIMEDMEFSKRMRRFGEAFVIEGKVVTSSRRFRNRGLFRTICKMQMLKLLYKLGVNPELLVLRYREKS
ncbi:MAG: TIGR04283 family arsenosugar biosynthesis glycosyltransferase [Dehalobacter sp.]|nr:TIGR04283 family arsenosugar biosynthesis glycosyltransferase [Dehalobacter sp.]